MPAAQVKVATPPVEEVGRMGGAEGVAKAETVEELRSPPKTTTGRRLPADVRWPSELCGREFTEKYDEVLKTTTKAIHRPCNHYVELASHNAFAQRSNLQDDHSIFRSAVLKSMEGL